MARSKHVCSQHGHNSYTGTSFIRRFFINLPFVRAFSVFLQFTPEVWACFVAKTHRYAAVIPPTFSPASRHTMTCYLATYFSGFHRNLPFLHLPTFSPNKCTVELILAMAAIGAQSAFDNDTAVMFFRTSHAILLESLHCRKAELRTKLFPTEDRSLTTPRFPNTLGLEGYLSASALSPGSIENRNNLEKYDPVSAAQTLLLLMAMAKWGDSKAIYNEAIGLQNTLANVFENLFKTRR